MRPTDSERCSVCDETPGLYTCDAADFGRPGVTHLQFMYDLRLARSNARDEQEFSHQLEIYALNRYLAPFRDNKNKKEGKIASRTVKSRNTRTSDLLDKKCHVRQGAVQCMRNAGHEGAHRF